MREKTGYPSIDKTHDEGLTFLQKHPLIPDISFYNLLRLLSISHRNEIAVDCLDLEVTYQQMLDDASMVSKSFKELGIKKNDIVAVNMPNLYQAVVTFLAANKIGAVTTFLNNYSATDEVKDYLNKFESPLLLNYNSSKEYNDSLIKDTKVKNIITLKNEELNNIQKKEKNGLIGYSNQLNYSDLGIVSTYCKSKFNTNFHRNNDALILFTSGTTGAPKAVVLTNENIAASLIYLKNSSDVRYDKTKSTLVCVPFTYPYGFSTSTLTTLASCRKAILAPNIGPTNLKYFLGKNPTDIYGSPALAKLIGRYAPEGQDYSSVDRFISGGDFLTQADEKQIIDTYAAHNNFHVKVCNGSGNAETNSCGTNSVGLECRKGSVGKVLFGTDVIVVNPDTMEEKKYGEAGLECITGKNVFKEYYKDPKKTADAKFEFNGKTYFKTGTMGILHEDRSFDLTGRESRFYITSSLNKVYCDRVQNIISSIDIVDQAAVVKKPDDDKLFVNKAFITLKNGVPRDEDTLNYIKEQCNEQLFMPLTGEPAQLKFNEIPSSFELVDTIPRTKADKVDYSSLEENARLEYELEKNMSTCKDKSLVYTRNNTNK